MRVHLRGRLIPVPHVLPLLLHQLQSRLNSFFLRHNRVMSNGLFVLPPFLCNPHRYPGIIRHHDREGPNSA
jgi:hypothetical protein